MSKYCPDCKTHLGISPDDFFCWKCGTSLETDKEYPDCSCGYTFSKQDIYCPKCGTKRNP